MGVSNPMLLTLFPPSAKPELDFKYPHDFVPRTSPPSKGTTFKADRDVLPPLQASASERMSTPHRGLPPPASMTLPDPGRIPPPMSSHFTGMPAPPSQWQGAEESMRSWLMTKAEEEKRKQEEERTRQESFRLEQRKIEQNMLSESMRNGVPPALIPIIFAGIGSSNLSSISIEWLQQYAGSLQNAQQQQFASQSQSQGSPDTRRDRLISQSQTYSSNQQQSQQLPAMSVLQGQQQSPGQPPPSGSQYSSYQTVVMSPTGGQRQPSTAASGPTSAPRPPPLQNVLPRLTTNEMQAPGGSPSAASGPHPQSGPTHAGQEQSQSSPSIYFHHWVPPSSQTGGNTPATPSEYVSSPKKRKAQGAHQSAPYHSPSFVHVSSNYSTTSRRGHTRQRSDSSTRGGHDPHGRATRNSVYSQGSPAETDEPNKRQRHYPVGGGGDDPSDSGSHSSYDPAKHSRKAADVGSVPVSPKREGGPVASTTSRKSSFGAHEPGS